MPAADGAISIALVVEGPTDCRVVRALIDRTLRDNVEWYDEAAGIPAWRPVGDDGAASYLRVAAIRERYAASPLPRLFPHHLGDSSSSKAEELAARKAFALFRRHTLPPDVVVFLRDTDGDDDRIRGLTRARTPTPAGGAWPFAVCVGVAAHNAECWLLCTYRPKNEQERSQLRDLTGRLAFDPTRQPDRLNSKDRNADRNPKTVVAQLGEERCLQDLAGLVRRELRDEHVSDASLAAFFDELQRALGRLLGFRAP